MAATGSGGDGGRAAVETERREREEWQRVNESSAVDINVLDK